MNKETLQDMQKANTYYDKWSLNGTYTIAINIADKVFEFLNNRNEEDR
ncbi:15658_t:CDS:2 [Funneliformis geosporum]|nr:15658_t:CDS:2 [Funneliformis geosporum]